MLSERQQWEYGLATFMHGEDVMKHMTDLWGSKGWEAYAVTVDDRYSYIWFKRPLEV